MVVVQNPDALSALRSQAGIPLVETPQGMQNTIVPVIDMTPRFHDLAIISKGSSATSSGTSTTVHNISSDKDFYLTAASLGLIKDATNDAATGNLSLQGTSNGSSALILRIPVLTLTAQNNTISLVFNPPLKLDRGTSISTSQGTFTAGNYVRVSCITGYEK